MQNSTISHQSSSDGLVEVIQIAEGVTFERKGAIQAYTVSTIQPKPLDEWIRTVTYSLKTASSREPVRLLYDLSGISIIQLTSMRYCDVGTLGLTVQNNDVLLAALDSRPELKVYLAVVMQPSLSAKVTRFTAIKVEGYERKFLFNVEAACKWLLTTPENSTK